MKIIHGEYYKDEDYYKKRFYKAIAEHELPEGYQSKRENEFLENHQYFLVADLTHRDLRKMRNVAYLDTSKLELISVTKEERKIHSSIATILEYQEKNKFDKIDDKELSSNPLEVVHWGYYKKKGDNYHIYNALDFDPLPEEYRDEECKKIEMLMKDYFDFNVVNLLETNLEVISRFKYIDTKKIDWFPATVEEIDVYNAICLI
ncbi:hypothetical protein [Enterococcus mundtii]|uniref:hypothetical protein n=1 Tax=Enterococcus mundtii TaxID=53346 RepID=UPI0003301A8A|nr:hypothetical protein [Enterococcus mundtii]EOH59113.1 hypothetical protein UAC_02950 [Enterococcus mundtii ATCC 882]EOU09345.1 hypothetical protein I587_02955 [Enterococcus mundtii ATCC 882]